jgi:hypothetical protein
MNLAFGARAQWAVQKNLAEHDLQVSEEEVQTLLGAVMAGRDVLEIDSAIGVLREAMIHLLARRVELENADRSLQEVECDFKALYEIIMARGPLHRTSPTYDDLYSSSSDSVESSSEGIGVVT